MPSLPGINSDWIVDSNTGIPLNEFLFLAFSRLKSLLRAQGTLYVALVELPATATTFTYTIGVCGCLRINVWIFCVLNVKLVMLSTDDFSAGFLVVTVSILNGLEIAMLTDINALTLSRWDSTTSWRNWSGESSCWRWGSCCEGSLSCGTSCSKASGLASCDRSSSESCLSSC